MSISSLEKFYKQFISFGENSLKEILLLVKDGKLNFSFPTPDRCDYEEIIEKLDEYIGGIFNVVNDPYITLKNEYELVHISKATKLSPKGVQMTTSDSSLWNENRPEFIYNKSLEEEYDSYENRLVKALIDKLSTFINGPLSDARYAIKNIYNEYFQSTRLNKFDLVKMIKTDTFLVSKDIFFKDFKKLYLLQSKLNFLKNTNFYKTLSKCPKFSGELKATNLFTYNKDYRTCYLMWNYLSTCLNNKKELEDENYASLYSFFIFLNFCSLLEKEGYILKNDLYLGNILDNFKVDNLEFSNDVFLVELQVEKVLDSYNYLLKINVTCLDNKETKLTKVLIKAFDDENISSADYNLSLYHVEYLDNCYTVTPSNENSLKDLEQLLKTCVFLVVASRAVYENLCIVCGANSINQEDDECSCEVCKASYSFIREDLLWLKDFKSNLIRK